MRRYRWTVAWKPGCSSLQRVGRVFRRSDFHRAGVVRLFSEPIQSYPGRNVRRWAHRDGIVALVVVARFCGACLVWMEISKLHYLANRASVGATGLFVVP